MIEIIQRCLKTNFYIKIYLIYQEYDTLGCKVMQLHYNVYFNNNLTNKHNK